jgi:hypothetical protein
MSANLLLSAVLGLAPQASDTVPPPSPARPPVVEGFVDVYYAYDFGRPELRDRVFTTQASRHNEVNVNLAHVALSLQRDRVRGRIALQAGTSVQANYAGEPSVGSNSGASLSRHVQEAVAGLRLAGSLWVDAGIYLSYLGLESWISRDNPTYSRSLVAEYSPYYESGVRITWQPASRLTLQGHLMNGWQKISEDNGAKAVGARLDFAMTPRLTVAWAGFIGNERPDGTPRTTRCFNQVMFKAEAWRGWQFQGEVDYGRQGAGARLQEWYGVAAIARLRLLSRLTGAARFERFADPDQVVAVTGSSAGLRVNGASLGMDLVLPGGALWRSELRGLRASHAMFPKRGVSDASRSNLVLVSSLALTL